MSRSKWKGPYVHKSFVKPKVGVINCWSRSITIVPAFVGKSLSVHNGQRFIQIKVVNYMIGHKLGEFAHTRKAYVHKKQK